MSERRPTALALSPPDRARIAEIDALAARGPAGLAELVAGLDEPSWPVRRAVVAALARAGDAATDPLIGVLRDRRELEARLAAAVDALAALRGNPEGALLALGAAAPPPVLCDVVVVLGRRRSQAAADALAGWTHHADDNVAVAAIEALGHLGGEAGIEALIEAASSGSFFRMFPAIDVLARVGDPRALAPLERLLGDPVAAAEAARALGRRGEPDAVPPLAALLASRADAMVRVAAVALVELADRQGERFGSGEAVAGAVRGAVPDRAAATRRLARSVIGGDPGERAAVCRLLGWLGTSGAAATLLDLLADVPLVAHAAGRALGELGEVAVREVLSAVRTGDSARRALLLSSVPARADVGDAVVGCLDDPDPDVRALACEVLARASAVSAVPSLFASLDDEDPRVSQAAAAAIQALGQADTEPLALQAATSSSPRVRRAALRMLGYFGWPSGVDPLLAALGSPDERMRDAAIHSLALIDDPRALDGLLGAVASGDPRARAAGARALGQVPELPPERRDEIVSRLVACLADPDAWVRYYAVQSIGRLRIAGHVDRLVERLGDEAGQVRIAVIDALARLPGDDARAALLAASAAVADPDLRRAALLGLASSGIEEGLPVVLDALATADPATRVIAVSALAGFEGSMVEEALAAAARDEDSHVRSAAVGALGGRPGVSSTVVLVGLLADDAARAPVLEALGRHTRGRVPGILAALESAAADASAALVAALARMHRADANAALGVALALDNVHARRAAATALGALGHRSARPLLEQAAAEDGDAQVRRIAAHLLPRR